MREIREGRSDQNPTALDRKRAQDRHRTAGVQDTNAAIARGAIACPHETRVAEAVGQIHNIRAGCDGLVHQCRCSSLKWRRGVDDHVPCADRLADRRTILDVEHKIAARPPRGDQRCASLGAKNPDDCRTKETTGAGNDNAVHRGLSRKRLASQTQGMKCGKQDSGRGDDRRVRSHRACDRERESRKPDRPAPCAEPGPHRRRRKHQGCACNRVESVCDDLGQECGKQRVARIAFRNPSDKQRVGEEVRNESRASDDERYPSEAWLRRSRGPPAEESAERDGRDHPDEPCRAPCVSVRCNICGARHGIRFDLAATADPHERGAGGSDMKSRAEARRLSGKRIGDPPPVDQIHGERHPPDQIVERDDRDHPERQLSVTHRKDKADRPKDLAHQSDPDQKPRDVVLDAASGDDHGAGSTFGIRESHLQIDQAVEANDHAETCPDAGM